MSTGQCYLCRNERTLAESHVIPKFVYRWLKKTSPGAIRSSEEIDKRVQDGYKDYLLCCDCEKRFNDWETTFANQIFHPFHSGSLQTFRYPYQEWALKFAVSVSWRVLIYHQHKDLLAHLSTEQLKILERAERLWRRFLLDQEPHPARFEQHLLPMEVLEGHTDPGLSPFFNRYILRTVGMDVASDNEFVLTYAKMGKLLLFGFINAPEAKKWEGTKIHARKGEISNTTFRVPTWIMEYINERATLVGEGFTRLSKAQREKTNQVFDRDSNVLMNLEYFRAIGQDLAFSGEAAYKITESKDE